ncbi:MAG: Crp/Fnr family transcriptional regulator, partial [Halobacteriales archaeon]|nr:Crp/Fnr family transcriptional regulator [Halobacteriales archaeon]
MMEPSVFESFEDFRELDGEDREALAQRMRRTTFGKGDALVRLLEPVQRIQVVLEGLAGLETVSVNGIRRVIWVFRPGDLIGSRAFLDESANDSEVKALTDGEVAVVSASEFERLSQQRPGLGLLVTRILTERFQGMSRKLLAATTLDVDMRLAKLLYEFMDGNASANGNPSANGGPPEESEDGFRPLAYPLTHETMAEIVGASRPHISATIGELEERGMLRRGRGGKL